MLRKNNDYADPEAKPDDKFAVWSNFRQCEHAEVCSTETGFLVRLSDKFSRLSNLLRPGHERTVSDESITDTLLDVINYAILLGGSLEAKKGGEG